MTSYAYDRLAALRLGLGLCQCPPPGRRSVQASAFHQTAFWYDSRGNVTAKVEGYYETEKRTTYYSYDKNNRLIQVTHDPVLWVGDHLANVGTEAPSDHFIYNPRGNLIETITGKTATVAGSRTLGYYDALDRKIAELEPGRHAQHLDLRRQRQRLAARVYADAVALPVTPGGSPPGPAGGGTYRETGFGYDRANRMHTEQRRRAQRGRLGRLDLLHLYRRGRHHERLRRRRQRRARL